MKKEFMLAAPDVVRQFLIYNEAIKNKSSSSIDEYFRDLQTFFRYIKIIKGKVFEDIPFDQIKINDVTIDLIKTINVNDLYSYLVFCKDERNNNSTTRARKVSTLRQFFKYLSVQTHMIDENSELITLYYGAETTEDEADALAQRIMAAYPGVEVECHPGNQPIYYYVISVE